MFFLFILIIGLAAWMGVSYNKLQKFSQEVKEKRSNIQVSISKKFSLVNQLVDLVQGYQVGEQLVHLKISNDANNSVLINSYQESGTVLASVKGMVERFPDLKSSGHYHRLMDEINSCELNLQRSREIYNSSVKNYNTNRSAIPTVFIAQTLGFSEAPYIEFDLSGANDVTHLKEFKTDDGERLKQIFSNAGNQIAGATKVITNQAVSSGKILGSKFSDNKQKPGNYFYMTPGGIPKGPIASNELLNLLSSGNIQQDTLVALAGSENWENISVLNTYPEE